MTIGQVCDWHDIKSFVQISKHEFSSPDGTAGIRCPDKYYD